MTQQTDQPTVDLRTGANAWKRRLDKQNTERRQQETREKRQRAEEQGPRILQRVFGQDLKAAGIELEEAVWTAVEQPEDSFGDTKQATATIQGLRFLAESRYRGYDYGGYTEELYVLRPCKNDKHEPADEQTEVTSLYQLAEVLEQPEVQTWICYACSWLVEEEREAQNAARPIVQVKTWGERFEEVVLEMIEERLGAREV